MKKELETMKKQRVDLLDKGEDLKQQVKDNEKLKHELDHLTQYYKDALKKVQELQKTIEDMKAEAKGRDEAIESLNHQLELQNH